MIKVLGIGGPSGILLRYLYPKFIKLIDTGKKYKQLDSKIIHLREVINTDKLAFAEQLQDYYQSKKEIEQSIKSNDKIFEDFVLEIETKLATGTEKMKNLSEKTESTSEKVDKIMIQLSEIEKNNSILDFRLKPLEDKVSKLDEKMDKSNDMISSMQTMLAEMRGYFKTL